MEGVDEKEKRDGDQGLWLPDLQRADGRDGQRCPEAGCSSRSVPTVGAAAPRSTGYSSEGSGGRVGWRLHVPGELYAGFGMIAPAMALALMVLMVAAVVTLPTSRLTHGR
jgi:hypothetical protein